MKTPLHTAAEENATACAQSLIQNGADIEAKDHKGQTPLLSNIDHRLLGSFQESIDVGEIPETFLYLLSHANVNAADHRGDTILHQAVLERAQTQVRTNLITAILDSQIDVERPSRPVITIELQDCEYIHLLPMRLRDYSPFTGPNCYSKKMDSQHVLGGPWVLFMAPDSPASLDTLLRMRRIKSVVYWYCGMTALDYAECLGDEVVAQMFRPRTKSTKESLTMLVRDYLVMYYPGYCLYKSNNGYEVLDSEYFPGSLDEIFEAMESSMSHQSSDECMTCLVIYGHLYKIFM